MTTPTTTDRHTDRVAIVTGAASGIGRATALRFAAEGASVVACDLDEQGLAETQAEGGERVVIGRADVTDNDDVNRVVALATDTFGRVDVLANVAGVMDNMLPPHELDDRTWERVMRVNVDGPMRLSRAVLRTYLDQGHGCIVNVASEAGLRGGAAGFAYTTSKHALIGQTRSIAWLYSALGIRCNAVLPGGVATNIGTSIDAPSAWALERLMPALGLSRGIAEPDDIAALISWLASDEAKNVNGALVTSDGGWSAA